MAFFRELEGAYNSYQRASPEQKRKAHEAVSFVKGLASFPRPGGILGLGKKRRKRKMKGGIIPLGLAAGPLLEKAVFSAYNAAKRKLKGGKRKTYRVSIV